MTNATTEKMNIVIVGHVDHGKSTLIGRLLADTHSLPVGKLDQVKRTCERTSKPFEYAFLLDALKDEQSQGITIDAARCFFKTKKRHYIIIDAPGHIEFLKNMVTGASHAEAALLLIDAKEGVKENSKRHGYLLSMLGIKQIVVLVNKMDLTNYSEERFQSIISEYKKFLNEINIKPLNFIPISAREGENITTLSDKMPWYTKQTALEQIDTFEKEKERHNKPFRLPIQDIYKFTNKNDDRRIIAGTVSSGSAKIGDSVVFLPSQKESTIKSIEAFNAPIKSQISAEEAVGITLETELYIRSGELMVKKDDIAPHVETSFRVNLFWLGKQPMVKNKAYKLKIGTDQTTVFLKETHTVLDASELDASKKKEQIDRHEVAEVTVECNKPIAFDLVSQNEQTSRFVIVDNYEIAGGGIIIKTEDTLQKSHQKQSLWKKSLLSIEERTQKLNQYPHWIILTGSNTETLSELAHELEVSLLDQGKTAYILSPKETINTTHPDEQTLRTYQDIASLLLDTGLCLISTVSQNDLLDALLHEKTTHYTTPLVISLGVSHSEHVAIQIDRSQDSNETIIKKILSKLKLNTLPNKQEEKTDEPLR